MWKTAFEIFEVTGSAEIHSWILCPKYAKILLLCRSRLLITMFMSKQYQIFYCFLDLQILKVLLLISRSLGLLHILTINTTIFFLSISFSPKYFHSVQNQNPLSSTNVLACMSPFPKYWSDRNTCFESNDHSSKLEPHVNLKADFPHHPFTAQHYFSIINVKFTLRKIL